MKPDPVVEMSAERAIAEMARHEGDGRSRRSSFHLAATAFRDAIGLVLVTLSIMVVAAIAAMLIVRVGADILQGIDPLASDVRRPRFYPQQMVLREVASDILRQCLIVTIVIGTAIWSAGKAWRAKLALSPVDRTRPRSFEASRHHPVLALPPYSVGDRDRGCLSHGVRTQCRPVAPAQQDGRGRLARLHDRPGSRGGRSC